MRLLTGHPEAATERLPRTFWSQARRESKQRAHRGPLCGWAAHIRQQATSSTCNCRSVQVYAYEPPVLFCRECALPWSHAGSCSAWPPPAVTGKQGLVQWFQDSACPPYLVVLLQRSLQLLHLLLLQLIRGARHRRGVEKPAGLQPTRSEQAGSVASMSGQACGREQKRGVQGALKHFRFCQAGAMRVGSPTRGARHLQTRHKHSSKA